MPFDYSAVDIVSRVAGIKNKGHMNSHGDVGLLKNKFRQNLNAGEKLVQTDFEMRFDGGPEMTSLVRAGQFPALGRNIIEDTVAGGGKIFMYGALQNSGEITVSVVETIEGQALLFLRKAINDARYVDVEFSAIVESRLGVPISPLEIRLKHCLFNVDAVDFNTEDVTALVKPNITITYNDIEFSMDESLMGMLQNKGADLLKRVLSPINIF